MRVHYLTLFLVLAFACGHLDPQQAQRSALAAAALDRIDPRAETRLVFADSLAAETRDLFLRHRQSARLAAEDELRFLPENVVRIDAMTVDGERATVRAWRGPVPRFGTQPVLACGTGYQLDFTWNGDAWELGNITVSVC